MNTRNSSNERGVGICYTRIFAATLAAIFAGMVWYGWSARTSAAPGGYSTQNLSIRLKAGWNLISLPLQPKTPVDARTLLTTLLTQTHGRYDELDTYANGRFRPQATYHGTDTRGFSGSNLSLKAGQGYALYTDKSGHWTVNGYDVRNATEQLAKGWNLVGFPQAITNPPDAVATLKILLNHTRGDRGMLIAAVDGRFTPNQPFSTWKSSTVLVYRDKTSLISSPSFVISAGQGYMLYSDQAYRWKLSAAVSVATASPTATRASSPSPTGTPTANTAPVTPISTLVPAPTATSVVTNPVAMNPIQAENALPGTANWQITSKTLSTDAHLIEGYASLTSVNRGGTISLFVNTAPATTFTIDTYRLGWYQGLGARLMRTDASLPGVQQPACPAEAGTGLIICGWSSSLTLNIPPNWTTGIYLARLTRADGFQNYIIFAVRDDSSRAPYFFQSSVTTFEAYNYWGGQSLYGGTGATEYNNDNRAYKVSFDRPYATPTRGPWEFLWREYQMVRWLEREGYDVAYGTDIDTHESLAMLLQHRAFLAVGHDEYWSKQMRSNVETALARGVSLGFFSANDMFYNIRLEPSALGPDRVITCYKVAKLDPMSSIDPSNVTVQWRQAPLSRPENAVIGQMYGEQLPAGSIGFPLVVTNSNAWPYNGAGVTDGTSIPNVMGYEYDHVVNNGFTPPGLIVLSSSDPVNHLGLADVTNTTVYTAPSGATVFSAGSVQWDYSLDSWGRGAPDSRIQTMTANVLARMAGSHN